MLKKYIFVFLILWIVQSCQPISHNKKNQYFAMVGDIENNLDIDDPNFKLCDEKTIAQYHHLNEEMQYEGEKYELLKTIKSQYKHPKNSTQSGMIRIRFIVNCKGKIGRFRMICAGFDYKEKQINNEITYQLMAITKNLKGWKILSDDSGPKDYYQYLIFKINNGYITEILP